MKKLLLTSSLAILITTDLFANGAVPPKPVDAPVVAAAPAYGCSDYFKSGFYVGLQGGYSSTRTRLNAVGPDYFSNELNSYGPINGDDNNFVGEVFAGARYTYSNCFVGGFELGGQFNSSKINRNLVGDLQGGQPGSYSLGLNHNFTLTPSLVFGRVLGERVFLYGKVGASITNFELNATDSNATFIGRSTKSVIGFAPAVGLEYAFSKFLSTRVELGGQFYGNDSRKLRQPLIANNQANLNLNTGAKTRVFNAKVGFVIKM